MADPYRAPKLPEPPREPLSEIAKIGIVLGIAALIIGAFALYALTYRRDPQELGPDGRCPSGYRVTTGLAGKPFCCPEGAACD